MLKDTLLSGVAFLAYLFLLMAASHAAVVTFNNPLVDAVDKGSRQEVVRLLKKGHSINSQGDFGVTALTRAAFRGNVEITKILIKAGANVDAADRGGATPLHIASRSGNVEVVKILIKYGADVNALDKGDWTPLMRAVKARKKNVVQELVQNGADVNIINERKETVLMHAVQTGLADMLVQIMASNSFKETPNQDKQKALETSKQLQMKAIENILSATIVAPPFVARVPGREEIIEGEKILDELQDRKAYDSASYDPVGKFSIPVPVLKRGSIPILPRPIMKPPVGERMSMLSAESRYGRGRQMAQNQRTSAPPRVRHPVVQPNRYERLPEPYDQYFTPPIDVLSGIKDKGPSISRDREVAGLPWKQFSNPAGSGDNSPAQINNNPVKPSADGRIYNASSNEMGGTGRAYLLQLGTFGLEGQARYMWNNMQKNNADVLGRLQSEVKATHLAFDNSTVFRLRAGSYTNRREADKACNSLRERNLECFVIESLLPSKPTSLPRTMEAKSPPPVIMQGQKEMASRAQAPKQITPRNTRTSIPSYPSPMMVAPQQALPVIDKRKVEQEYLKQKRKIFAARQGYTNPEAQNRITHQDFYRELQAGSLNTGNVSEAVPVSEQEFKRAGGGMVSQSNALGQMAGGSGSWLHIGYFPSDTIAEDYWLRTFKFDEALSKTTMMIVKVPDNQTGQMKTSLRVGPFNNPYQSRDLCRSVKQGGLSCLTLGSPSQDGSSGNDMAANEASKPVPKNNYWLHLGTFSDSTEAEFYWMFLNEGNNDIMAQLEYNTSSGNPRQQDEIRLRAGPFNANQHAAYVCDALKKRNVACLVVKAN